jgi:hypothetical protein
MPSLVEITARVVGTNSIKAILGSKGFRVTFSLQLIPFRHKLINILLTNSECDSVSRIYGRDGLPLIRGKSILVSPRIHFNVDGQRSAYMLPLRGVNLTYVLAFAQLPGQNSNTGLQAW